MCRVTMGHLRLTIGYLKASVVNIRVTLDHLRVTIGHFRVTIGYIFSISKHKANTTELHPNVRQTCLQLFSENCVILHLLLLAAQLQLVAAQDNISNLVSEHSLCEETMIL